MAALLVEFVDELVDGTKGAALPLISRDLHLTYGAVGLLVGLPLLVGGLIELPFGLVAGHGERRHRLVVAGGAVFLASLAVVAAASSFAPLLLAFTAFFPASGAFVGLTESALMDADPARQQQRMAAWNLAGSLGAVAGPVLLAAVLAAGGTWRAGYLALAAGAGLAFVAVAFAGPARTGRADPAKTGQAEPAKQGRADSSPVNAAGSAGNAGSAADADADRRIGLREALGSLRNGLTARWLLLLQVSDLLLDVLTGFVGIYLVDVAHASPAQAAVGVAIRLGAGLAGDAVFVFLAGRVGARAVLRASAIVAGLLYPAFLIAPALSAKLAILAVLSVATACWYPVLQAGLYGSVPGQSGIVVFLSSAAGLVGAVGPLAVGFIAQRFGLTPALACLAATPAVLFFLS